MQIKGFLGGGGGEGIRKIGEPSEKEVKYERVVKEAL